MKEEDSCCWNRTPNKDFACLPALSTVRDTVGIALSTAILCNAYSLQALGMKLIFFTL